jgi:hypothetical protein
VTEQLHLAYSAQDDSGLSRDVSVLMDSENDGPLMTGDLMDRLTAFLRATGLIGPTEIVTNTFA